MEMKMQNLQEIETKTKTNKFKMLKLMMENEAKLTYGGRCRWRG